MDGEVRQLVEVKLSVVHSSHTLPNSEQRYIEHSNINDLAADGDSQTL
jgi:hypothetical protein